MAARCGIIVLLMGYVGALVIDELLGSVNNPTDGSIG
jgi:hypothetical protein